MDKIICFLDYCGLSCQVSQSGGTRQGEMVTFRGHETARIDDKGRIKIPAKIKKLLDASNTSKLFATAITNDAVSLYPIPVWEAIESKVLELGRLHPKRRAFDKRVHYFGSEVDMDAQGRIPLKPIQRELLHNPENVVLLGCIDHLELFPAMEFTENERPAELTELDLEELGI